jgi:hypothetical protein
MLAAVAAPVRAQDSPEGWLVAFAAAYQPDVSGFNAKFSQYGIPEARVRHYGWGIEVRSLVSGFLIGPLFFRTWDDTDNGSFQLRTDATGIFGEAGLKLAPAKFLTFVPMLGLGGLSQSFNIRPEKTDNLKLDSLLMSPGRTATISPGMKLAGLAALELDLTAGTNTGRYGVALRAGYMYSPFALNWHLSNGADIVDAPATHIGGPFFSAGILLLPAAQTAGSQP